MNTLFDLDSVPVAEVNTKKKSKSEYYLRAVSADKWYFLWKTHANGGCVWMPEVDLTINGGNKKPLRYRTLSGAQRMLSVYVREGIQKEVAAWKENS